MVLSHPRFFLDDRSLFEICNFFHKGAHRLSGHCLWFFRSTRKFRKLNIACGGVYWGGLNRWCVGKIDWRSKLLLLLFSFETRFAGLRADIILLHVGPRLKISSVCFRHIVFSGWVPFQILTSKDEYIPLCISKMWIISTVTQFFWLDFNSASPACIRPSQRQKGFYPLHQRFSFSRFLAFFFPSHFSWARFVRRVCIVFSPRFVCMLCFFRFFKF